MRSQPPPSEIKREKERRGEVVKKLTYQMRPPQLIHRLGIVQLNVQILIYALERPADLHFVLEFDGDFVLYECFEEAAWVLGLVYCTSALRGER